MGQEANKSITRNISDSNLCCLYSVQSNAMWRVWVVQEDFLEKVAFSLSEM